MIFMGMKKLEQSDDLSEDDLSIKVIHCLTLIKVNNLIKVIHFKKATNEFYLDDKKIINNISFIMMMKLINVMETHHGKVQNHHSK